MIELRKNYSAFINGDIKFILEDNNKILAYIRENSNQKIVVICNFYRNIEKISVDEIFSDSYEKIFGNYDGVNIIDNEINLRSYEAVVFLI